MWFISGCFWSEVTVSKSNWLSNQGRLLSHTTHSSEVSLRTVFFCLGLSLFCLRLVSLVVSYKSCCCNFQLHIFIKLHLKKGKAKKIKGKAIFPHISFLSIRSTCTCPTSPQKISSLFPLTQIRSLWKLISDMISLCGSGLLGREKLRGSCGNGIEGKDAHCLPKGRCATNLLIFFLLDILIVCRFYCKQWCSEYPYNPFWGTCLIMSLREFLQVEWLVQRD